MNKLLEFFSPDDFKDRPYVGGLNQMGHVVFGAALEVVVGGWVGMFFILSWEIYQFSRLSSLKSDTRIDSCFWLLGLYIGGAVYLPVVAVAAGGLWMGYLWIRN